ncbi:hypothetical protein HZ326_31739 [Fusarium oxysporum f. sp. albedinis]|nr:hypothetical protein HZ326_31739 [Fusarium oxysporum f. sp. albedinis]
MVDAQFSATPRTSNNPCLKSPSLSEQSGRAGGSHSSLHSESTLRDPPPTGNVEKPSNRRHRGPHHLCIPSSYVSTQGDDWRLLGEKGLLWASHRLPK